MPTSVEHGESVAVEVTCSDHALTVVLDQLSKSWIVGYFDAASSAAPALPVPQRVVAPFFNLVLTWNRGMSFGGRGLAS